MSLIHLRIWLWSNRTNTFWTVIPSFAQNPEDFIHALTEAADDVVRDLI